MKFKTIFKKLKKHDKKPTPLNNRLSPTSPSPISSPNTTSPLSLKPVEFPQRRPSSFIPNYQHSPVDYPSRRPSSIQNYQVNVYGRKFSTSTTSSNSLQTSFPPNSYFVQPIKQNKVIEENQESFDYSQVSTIPSPSRRESLVVKQRISGQDNIDKISTGKINSLNDETMYNTATLVNSNDEAVTSFPSKNSCSPPNEISNTLNPLVLSLRKSESNEEEKMNNDIDVGNDVVNNCVEGKPETEIMSITEKPVTALPMAMATPPHSPLSSTLSISSPKKKNHSIFGYLKKKDKKEKELKTVYKNFSVMDTQSIEHEGLIMVENQNNALHSLWEQRNSDLMKKNNPMNKVVSPTSPINTSKPSNIDRISITPMSLENKNTSPINIPMKLEDKGITSPIKSPLNRQRKSFSPLNSPLNYERKNITPIGSPISNERKNVSSLNSPLIYKRTSSKNSPVSSPKYNTLSLPIKHERISSPINSPNQERLSLNNFERMGDSPVHSQVNLDKISTGPLFSFNSLERITNPQNVSLNHKRISPPNSPVSPTRISSLKHSPVGCTRVSPPNSPVNHDRISPTHSPVDHDRINQLNTLLYNTSPYSTSPYNIPLSFERNSITPFNSPNQYNSPGNLEIKSASPLTSPNNVKQLRNSYCNGEVDHTPSIPKSSINNPYATLPRYKIYMNDKNKDSTLEPTSNTVKSSKVNSPDTEKLYIPGRNDSLFNNVTSSSHKTMSPLHPTMKNDVNNNSNNNNNNIRTNLRINTNPSVRVIHAPFSPNNNSLKLTSPLPPLRSRKSPALDNHKLSSPISPNSHVFNEDILKEDVKGSNDPESESISKETISKETISLLNSIVEKEKDSVFADILGTEKEKQKEKIFANVLENDEEKESVLANYLAECTQEESDIISDSEKVKEKEKEIIEKEEITENSNEKKSEGEDDKVQTELDIEDGSEEKIESTTATNCNLSSSSRSYTESVKSKTSTFSKISNSVKTSLKSFAKSIGDKDELDENNEISRISKSSSISSFSSSGSSESSESDDNESNHFDSPISKNSTTEEVQNNVPLNQEDAIKYNIENMKPIKIIQEPKNKLGKRTSGILKNKSSNSVLKNKSSYSIIKNRNSNGFNGLTYGDIAAFPLNIDNMPTQKLNNKISIESKKSRVSFCESKNIYRNITIDRKSSTKLKRISNGSSIVPYIVEKSLNQTTILNESSIKFDNYNTTTESFSILKGNFNDDSMNANIGFSDNEMNPSSPIESEFGRNIQHMPSLSSINFSYDSDIVAEVSEEKIKIFDPQLINNETHSSATIYHNGKTNSLEDPLNKRQTSNTFHNDDDEISNFFESQSDNRTSFIVIGKDSTVLKDDSLFEKEPQDTTSNTNIKKEHRTSKLRNDILSSSESVDSPTSINAIRHFPQNGNAFEYTPSNPPSPVISSTTQVNNNVNKKESLPLINDYTSVKSRNSEPCEKTNYLNNSKNMECKERSVKSAGDVDTIKNIDFFDFNLDFNLDLGLKEEICKQINMEKEVEEEIDYELSSLEVEGSPDDSEGDTNNRKNDLSPISPVSSPLTTTTATTTTNNTVNTNFVEPKRNNTNDFKFNNIKKLIRNKKSSDESNTSNSQSSEDDEKSNHIKFNNKEIKRIKSQKKENRSKDIKEGNQEIVINSSFKQVKSGKLDIPFRRSSSKKSKGDKLELPLKTLSIKSSKDNKQEIPKRSSSYINPNMINNDNVDNEKIVRATSINNASYMNNENVIRRSSTKRSVNDYSKTVQDCIQQLVPVLENFDSQFSPSKETQKNEITLQKNNSIKNINTKVSTSDKKEIQLEDNISKHKKMDKSFEKKSAPLRMSLIDNDSFKFIEDMDNSDNSMKPSKIPVPVKDADGLITIVVGNQEVTHYDHKGAKSQCSSQDDKNKSIHKSLCDGATLVGSDRYSKSIQKSNVGSTTLVNSEVNRSSYPSKLKQPSKIVRGGKRKPASLLPRNDSLRILKDQYPKEIIDSKDIYVAKCVEVEGKKCIKSERISANEIKNKISHYQKYQSDPLKSSIPVPSDPISKTKSLDVNNMTFSRRSSSLINPTSVPSPLLYNKKVLKVKREGLPQRKRRSHRVIKKTSQSSSLRISTVLNEEQMMAKKSWETKDDESLSTSKHNSHRTRSRSFGPGDLSKYYMAALANVMSSNSSSNGDTTTSSKTNQEVLKELNESGIISFRRNSADQYTNNDITSPIFAKINGFTNLEFIELYLDIVERNLSLDELLQRISK